jgi:hypothetical protein
MAAIFMSFIHEEEGTVLWVRHFIHEVLQGAVESFMSSDESIIYAGEDWMARIFAELKDAKVLVSMLSPTSVTRPWINFEAGAAWMRDCKVIPVCFAGLTAGQLPKPYSSLQAVDISTHEGAFYLVSSIAHHLGLPAPEKPYFSKHPSPLAMDDAGRERNKKLFAPYLRLQLMVDFVKLAQNPTSPNS